MTGLETASLSLLDYFVIGAYLVIVAGISWRTSRRQNSTTEYFIANRRIPAFAVGFTIMATTVSSVTFVAIPGSVFARNWWQMLYMLMAVLSLIVVVIWIVPFYRRVVKMSAYEYLERRFGFGARLYGSAGFVVLRLADLGFTLYLTAVAVEVVTGWDIRWVVAAVGLFTLVYTLVGGIEAAIWTSVVQGMIFVGAAVAILGVILLSPAQGPGAVIANAFQAGKFNLGNFDLSASSLYRDEATAWILILAGLLHFTRYYVTEQNVIQRYLVARSDREAQRGVTMGILITVPTWFTFAFIGACLWSFYQLTNYSVPAEVLERPDNILPYFIGSRLPVGLVGLILAGLLSSAMSSVSADLNSIATVVTRDYFARALPDSSDRSQLLFGRFGVLAGGLLATGAALILTFTRSTAAYEIVVISVSIIAGGALGLFGLGFLTRRATTRGCYAGIVACLLFVGWGTLTGPLGVNLGLNFTMNTLLIGVFSHFVLFGVGYVASLVLGGDRVDLKGLTVWRD
jgi:SSS family solute:Na+ symporter